MDNTGPAARITNLALANALPHAVLISGPAGIGKYEFWEHLAKKLLKTEKLLPPDTVKADVLYQEDITSDAELASSTFDQSHRKKKKTKSNTIGIDDIESITRHLFDTTDSPYKIVIIRNIERMTIEASNTFLKILEEPPQKTLFFLTTSAEADIVPTIFSRVQKEYFHRWTDEKIEQYISISLEENVKKWLVKIANGRIIILQKLMHQKDYFVEQQNNWLFFESFPLKSVSEKIKWAEEISKNTTDELTALLDTALEVYQYCLRQYLATKDKKITACYTLLSRIAQAKNDIIANGNKRLIMELLCIDWVL